MLRTIKISLLLIALITLSSCKTTDVQRVLDTLGGANQPLSEQTVVAGLKEALKLALKIPYLKPIKQVVSVITH